MIPYFEPPALHLPLGQKIDVFGVLSTVGVVVGALVAERMAKRDRLDLAPLRGVIPWLVGCGLVGAHAMHVFLYHPELLRQDPWSVLRIWDGLSSTGGVLGALGGLFFYFRRAGLEVTPYLNPLALGTAPGWAIARVGCFLVHDHPGVRTEFPLAVDFPVVPYGGPRHDLGLYDALWLLVIAAVLFALDRKKPGPGRLMGWLAVLYAPVRFAFDFLRASDLSFVDRRYAGLTPGQYVVVGLFVVGVWLLTRKAPQTGAQRS
ncbi:MAG: prolipoprotein diacylglyceryl transferase family protein [Myxococcota bacterium]